VTVSGHPAHIVRLDAARFPQVKASDESENRHHMYIDMARGERAEFRELIQEPALYRVHTPDGAVLCSVTAGPELKNLGRSPSAAPQADPK
jgi:hypothetical protein